MNFNIAYRMFVSLFLFAFFGFVPLANAQTNYGGITNAQYDQLRQALLRNNGALSQKWGQKHSINVTTCTDAGLNALHVGIDYQAPRGTQVYAPVGGIVIRKALPSGNPCAATSTDCLSTLAIYNEQSKRTYIFLHLDTISVEVNASVSPGESIGTVGKRGATGEHLHYEVRAGKRINAALCISNTINPYTNTIISTTPPPSGASPTAWEFSINGDYQGWTVSHASASSVNGGSLFIDPSGLDPFVTGPEISVNASTYRHVRIKMASNGLDSTGAVYFKTEAENFWSPDKFVDFTVLNCSLCGNAETYVYPVNMYDRNDKWRGTITAIRIDPTGNGQGGTNRDSIGIDYIRLDAQVSVSGTTDPFPTFAGSAFAPTNSFTTGETIPLTVAITNAGEIVSNVIVDVEIYNSANQKVFQYPYENQNFAPEETREYFLNWQVSTSSEYKVKVGVFNSSWTINYYWNDDAFSLFISTGSPPPPAANSIDIWWPTDGAQVSGTQPFQAIVTGLSLSQYNLYWQVDSGQLNFIPDNFNNYPHKEVMVDLSGWTWRGTGPYLVNFVAKDLNGNTIAQRAVNIYVSP